MNVDVGADGLPFGLLAPVRGEKGKDVPNVTKEEVEKALQILVAVGRTIQELGQVPAGHLYATVQGILSMEAFQSVILNLENAKLIRYDDNHLITWIGPRPSGKDGDGPHG